MPDQVLGHLKQYHRHLSLAIRKEIVRIVDDLPDLARELKKVRYPHATTGYILLLDVFGDRLQYLGV